MKETKSVTTEQFLEYLESLDLFRWTIKETENGIEAVLSQNNKPKLDNFTQIEKQADGAIWVRLSKKDFFNDSITKGFFNKFKKDMAHSKIINPFIVALAELNNAENFTLDNDAIRTDKLSVVRSFSLGDNLLPIQTVSIEENDVNVYRVSSEYLSEEELKELNKAFNYTLTVLQNKKLRNIQERKKLWISLSN